MKVKLKLLLLAVCALMLLTQYACKKDDTNPPTTTCDTVWVRNDIVSATTWQANKVYIIDAGTTLNIQAQLTIEPGCIIKFASWYGINVNGSGKINATGTSTAPIIFTSIKDDSYCGDTNGDGTTTAAAKGDWGGIQIENGVTGNSFVYCKFFYAGANDPNGGYLHTVIEDNANGSTYDHCTFAHTSSPASVTTGDYGALRLYGTGTAYVCTNNIFYDNGIPVFVLYADAVSNIDNSNIFHDPANVNTVNKFQCIKVTDMGTAISGSAEYKVNTIPYFMDVNNLTIASTGSLTIADNAVLKFDGSSITYYNTSVLNNVNGSSVRLTSLNDDTLGDSNGDGSATSPANGDWVGVYLSDITGTWQTWSNIYYDSH
ncbi:MAG: hypothetical protein U0V74_14845 [Chitinophagales bacterium]